MLKDIKHFLIMMLAMWAVVFMPAKAMAYDVLTCEDDGTVTDDTYLYFQDPAAPDDAPSFCSEVDATRIFSTVICNFVLILNDVLGKVYCGMQVSLQKYVAILITIYIAVFAIQILMGMTQLNSREMLVRFAKIGAVWAFVSNANWGVNLLFIFFIDFANQGMVWALGSISDGVNDISDIMNLPSDPAEGVSGAVPAYVYIDGLIYDALTGPVSEANSKMLGLFAALGLAFPPVFMVAAYWVWTTFLILARTFIAFLMSLSAIAFLIAMSPIFFCFMLFQITFQFFEIWLKYMISYSLQVLIVFSVVAMWILVMFNFVDFFNQLSNVVYPYYKMQKGGPVSVDKKSVGICPYIVSEGVAPGLLGPNIECADPDFNPGETTTIILPYFGAITVPTTRGIEDSNKLIDLYNIAPSQDETEEESPNPACDDELPADAPQCHLTRFYYFLVYHLITLIIIAYAFDALLKRAPYLAKELSGPQYVPILGQGFGGLGYNKMRGVSKMRDKNSGAFGGVRNAATDFIENSRNTRGRTDGKS